MSSLTRLFSNGGGESLNTLQAKNLISQSLLEDTICTERDQKQRKKWFVTRVHFSLGVTSTIFEIQMFTVCKRVTSLLFVHFLAHTLFF